MINAEYRNILLVEDDPETAGDLKRSLEGCGYNVLAVSSGAEALTAVKNGADINLLLADIYSGSGMSGSEAAERILGIKDIPVLFMYGADEASAASRSGGFTPYGFVAKNAGAEILNASIQVAAKLHSEKLKLQSDRLFYEESGYRQIVESANSIILRMDTSGNIIYMNEFGLNFFGFTMDELRGRNVVGTIVPAVDRANNNLELMITDIVKDTEKHVSNENENMRRDGSRVWVAWSNRAIRESSGRCMEILCIGNDITKRIEFEEKIRETSGRYRTLVESQLELVCVWLPDTTLTFVNQAYCSHIGKSREELTGKRWIEFIPESSREEVLENYRKAVEAKQVYSYVHEVKTGDGIRWYRWNDVPLFNKDGDLVEFQSVGHDITERRIADEKINALLSEKELTLKEVHHRIKNNMSTVKALLVMQAESIGDPGAVSALREAANRVQSMSALYDKLYTSYSYTEMPVTYYLSPLVDEIIANFPGSGSVRIEKSFDDFSLNVSLLQPLGIIINELITNVMKYAFNGISDGCIRLSLKKKGKRVKLVLQDNGIGMPESVDLNSSSGFGMQLVSTLAAQIGARISIERRNGTGFTLEFSV